MIGYVWASNLLLYLALRRLSRNVLAPGWRRALAAFLAALAGIVVIVGAYQWAPNSAYGRGLTLEALQSGWTWAWVLVILQEAVFYAYVLQAWYRQRHPVPVPVTQPSGKKRRRPRPHHRRAGR